ncbi:MAG: beta-lactamase family protein [Bacteroidales bacterium]|jgi:CubicO group peptidase (beta-lactamase class C family)|nr:beta-lactamase family protein [Bacteroidales bacterium]
MEKSFGKTSLPHALLIVMMLSAIISTKSWSQQPPESVNPTLDDFFTTLMDKYKFVGIGACLIKDNDIVWRGNYGYANMETGKMINDESIFQLSSISKTVTAFALLKLFDEGKLDIDESIDKHLQFKFRNPYFPDKEITFRMLLNHTSGLADVTSTGLVVPAKVGRPQSSRGDSDMTLEEYITQLCIPGGRYYSEEYFKNTEPGTSYNYSNIGYALLGYLVQRISGEDFSAFCRKNIFDPLGMHDTGWHLRDLDTSRVIFSYSFSPEDTVPVYRKTYHFGEPGYPAGMVRTTMDDFSRFLIMIMNHGRHGDVQLLKPSTIDLMLSPQNIPNMSSRSFKLIDKSLCWLMIETNGSQYYEMNGFSGSIFTDALFSPEKGTGMIYYFSGINMKNMVAVPEIVNALDEALKEY